MMERKNIRRKKKGKEKERKEKSILETVKCAWKEFGSSVFNTEIDDVYSFVEKGIWCEFISTKKIIWI